MEFWKRLLWWLWFLCVGPFQRAELHHVSKPVTKKLTYISKQEILYFTVRIKDYSLPNSNMKSRWTSFCTHKTAHRIRKSLSLHILLINRLKPKIGCSLNISSWIFFLNFPVTRTWTARIMSNGNGFSEKWLWTKRENKENILNRQANDSNMTKKRKSFILENMKNKIR